MKRVQKKAFLRKAILYVAVLGLVVAASSLAVADDDDNGRSTGPQPNVARISLIHGDVSMQRSDSGDWAAATVNTPMVRGDQVATGEKSRAEIQLDYANVLRLSSQSQAKIADLTRTRIQVQLGQGYAYYTIFKGSEADVEIDTPNVAVKPLKKGRYRIQVNSDDETEVIVRDGEAEITTPQGSTTVKDGNRITIRGAAETAEYKVDDAPSGDDWDHWNKDRNREIQDAQSWQRTSPYYTGAQDLDTYGRWVFIPGYGQVWQPYQNAGWAPYQTGRWVWEPYWGWTWVSYEPWGWAPYHYGRWFISGGSWVWWPGPAYVRPVYAPAFVTFIGFGHNAGFAFGFGSIGWIPVGPFDPCYPWWGRGFNRVNVVNITNINVINGRGFIGPLGVRGRQPYISNLRLAMTDPRMRSSISGVRAEEFGRGTARVQSLGIREGEWRESRAMTGNLPVVPTRESLHTGAEGHPGVQPRNNERFFTRSQPPRALPGFHEQANRLQQTIRTNAPNERMSGARGEENRGDFHSFGRPGAGDSGRMGSGSVTGRQGSESSRGEQSARQDQNGRQENRGGWSKFGPPAGGARVDTEDRGGRADQHPGASRENNQGPRIDRTNPSSSRPGGSEERGGDRGGWQRFPSSSSSERNEGPMVGGRDRSNDRANDRPDRPNDRSDRANDRPSKPPLELNKPIVTPRAPESRTPQPPSRGPDMRNEPRGGGSYDRGPGYGRGESGGYDRSPGVSRGNSGGDYDRGGSRSGSSGGSYDRGGSRSGSSGGSYDRGGSHSSGGGSRSGGGGGEKGGSRSSGSGHGR